MYWLCHISTWIHHRYTRVPHPEPSSLLPPRTIPLSRPSAFFKLRYNLQRIQFTYHKCPAQWFLSKYIQFCNHYYNSVLEYFITQQSSLGSICSHSEFPLPASGKHCSGFFIVLSSLDISCNWNHTMWSLLYLASFV